MTQFRKKPVLVEAIRLDDQACWDCWIDGKLVFGKFYVSGSFHRERHEIHSAWLTIDTLEGRMVAQLGDWIIKGVHGEYYPCKPDIFEATYDSLPSPDVAGLDEVTEAIKPMALPCSCYGPDGDGCSCGNYDDANNQGFAQGWNACLEAMRAAAPTRPPEDVIERCAALCDARVAMIDASFPKGIKYALGAHNEAVSLALAIRALAQSGSGK